MTYDKLDKAFSEFIRLSESNDSGYGNCISCGKLVRWKDADCGHYVNRKHLSLRWNKTNCHLQCRACNRFDEGNIPAYTLALEKRYGKGIVEQLLATKRATAKWTQAEIDLMTKHYQEEAKKLKEEKELSN